MTLPQYLANCEIFRGATDIYLKEKIMKTPDETMFAMLIHHFGAERIISALPQAEVVAVLGLVSVSELTKALNVNYSTLRYSMSVGIIPYPEVRLLRRAYYSPQQAEHIKQTWGSHK